jgi:hypothetical protein
MINNVENNTDLDKYEVGQIIHYIQNKVYTFSLNVGPLRYDKYDIAYIPYTSGEYSISKESLYLKKDERVRRYKIKFDTEIKIDGVNR